jgi:hypothetical protein
MSGCGKRHFSADFADYWREKQLEYGFRCGCPLRCMTQAEVQKKVSAGMRQVTRVRSVVTLGMFAVAMVLSLKFPLWGFGLVLCVLFAYLRPEASAEHS